MADFNAQIVLGADAKKAYREITKVERSVDKLDKKASNIDVKLKVDDSGIRRVD